jgi:hypothetical protein
MPTIKEILQTMDYGPAPESTKEAQAWLDQHGRRFGLFIDNQWSAPGATFATSNPADGSALAQITQATNDDVQRAVDAASRAHPAWVAMGGHGRATVLYTLARLLQKHARLFAVLERWTTARPSAKPATPICRWPRATSITTPAGRNCSRKNSPTTAPWAWWARSCRGTSRC